MTIGRADTAEPQRGYQRAEENIHFCRLYCILVFGGDAILVPGIPGNEIREREMESFNLLVEIASNPSRGMSAKQKSYVEWAAKLEREASGRLLAGDATSFWGLTASADAFWITAINGSMLDHKK